MKSICTTNRIGHKHWHLNGKLHREDGPAIEYADGEEWWYLNGKLHREGGPAIKYVNGDKYWYLNNFLHREDGPACESFDGYKFWYYRGKPIYCRDNKEFLRMIKLIAFL